MEIKAMEMKNSRTVLQVAGVIDFVFGIPGVLLGILGIAGAAAIANIPELSEEAAGVSAALMGGGSVLIILASMVAVIEGILTLRAVKNPTKIMPVWVLALIYLGFSVIGMVYALSMSSVGTTDVVRLALNAFVFYAANSMKVAVGK